MSKGSRQSTFSVRRKKHKRNKLFVCPGKVSLRVPLMKKKENGTLFATGDWSPSVPDSVVLDDFRAHYLAPYVPFNLIRS